MPRIATGYGIQYDQPFILVERVPWRVAIAVTVTEWLCKLTRHYFCMMLSGDVYEWADLFTEKFQTPCTKEQAAAFAEWHGWDRPFFMEDEEAPARYERMP